MCIEQSFRALSLILSNILIVKAYGVYRILGQHMESWFVRPIGRYCEK